MSPLQLIGPAQLGVLLLVVFLGLAGAQTPIPAPGGQTKITVQFIIRDFVGQYPNGVPAGANKTTHPDFERSQVYEPGIILPTLGPDRNPQRNTSVISKSWTNTTCFNWAWNDVPGVNYRLTRSFDLNWNSTSGLYSYANGLFLPINNDGFGNYASYNRNYHFCLVYHTQFRYNGNELFSFTGDDDVYFFVNNRLFIDLGGPHTPITANRDLRNATAAKLQFNMDVGSVYNFDLFYCERHATGSSLTMATNILLNDCAFLDACGDCSSTPPTKTVNPCTVLNCNNGLCSCQNASCICNAGWTNGPNGNCSQNCGDGIIQGNEQCDPPGPCCTSTCRFAALNTACPSGGRPCVNYVCTGNSSVCGIPRAVGSPCTGTAIPPQCQQYQCTAVDGSACSLVSSANLNCSDNNPCTTDSCTASGLCQSVTLPCPSVVCRNPSVCDAGTGACPQGTPVADGTGCGPDPGPTSCVQPTCVSGECSLTPKPLNTPCGADAADGCSTQVCDGTTGTCVSKAIANKQGTAANCTQPGAGSCLQALCSGLACTNFAIPDGSACSASLTLNSCQRPGCVNGVCSVLPDSAREGQACTDGGALANFGDDQCNVKVCTNGQCVRKANTAIDDTACAITAGGVGANPEQTCRSYQCQAGTCARANINEAATCVNASLTTTNCTRLQCNSGTCTVTPFNSGGQCNDPTDDGCTFFRCDNTGACTSQFAPVNISCGPTDLKCNLSFCTSLGKCAQQPVTCDSAICGGLLRCNQSLGVCEIPAGQAALCCGNGKVDNAGEECDNPSDPCCIGCKWAPINSACSTNECNPKRCTLVAGTTSNTTCTDNFQNNVPCSSAPAASDQCKQLRCGNSTGVCTEVNKLDDTPCTLSGVPFCAQAVCRSGACAIVSNAALAGQDCSSAYGSVPECNQAVCAGTACVLVSANDGADCAVLPATECRDRKCNGGSCVYTFGAYPKSLATTCTALTSNTKCLQPGCDGSGNCILLNVTAGTACDRDYNADCTLPQCDGGGVCALKAINIGATCAAAHDQQCQVATCDLNGACVVSNVADNAPCTRTDVGQCQDAQCRAGACVLVNTTEVQRACEPTPNLAEDRSCLLYYCQADGTCETPTNKADGTPCPDANRCDTDTCKGGVCTHVVSVTCDQPTQPCEVPIGTCLPAYGNCTYGGRGQYAACFPRAAELDERCNASVVGAYRCASGAPNSICTPSCFAGGVCGDGIVQDGEDCDWGDERTGGPCCNLTCKWFQELAPCAYTDPEKVAAVTAQIESLAKSSDLPAVCFVQRCVTQSGVSQCVLGLDSTTDKRCANGGNSKSNRTAILASVIPGALIALCLAGLGFFLWRRAQKAAESEWLQEYLNAGNVRVENNAAFVETQASVNNAVFQPDGSK